MWASWQTNCIRVNGDVKKLHSAEWMTGRDWKNSVIASSLYVSLSYTVASEGPRGLVEMLLFCILSGFNAVSIINYIISIRTWVKWNRKNIYEKFSSEEIWHGKRNPYDLVHRGINMVYITCLFSLKRYLEIVRNLQYWILLIKHTHTGKNQESCGKVFSVTRKVWMTPIINSSEEAEELYVWDLDIVMFFKLLFVVIICELKKKNDFLFPVFLMAMVHRNK